MVLALQLVADVASTAAGTAAAAAEATVEATVEAVAAVVEVAAAAAPEEEAHVEAIEPSMLDASMRWAFGDTVDFSGVGNVSDLAQLYGRWWLDLVRSDPYHVVVETALIVFIIYILIIKKTTNPRASAQGKLSKKDVAELLDEWEPEPLVPALSQAEEKLVANTAVVERVQGNYLELRPGAGAGGRGQAKRALNMSSFDFLGMGQQPQLKEAALRVLDKYGCGSCGPRGFYGTIDQHMFLEDRFTEFCAPYEAIMYSDSATTVSSCIPAFSKKGDVIIADRGVGEAVQTGLNLSRSIVRTFNHNDMTDLEAVLEEIREEDLRTKRNVLEQRRFIVVEGLYRNYGDVCPLAELLDLKNKYKYRLILDESFSFGVLGQTGRGVTEEFGLPFSCAEVITISLAHSMASIGGICIGATDVVNHQRLSAAGYCFSAAAPPFVSAVAAESLRLMQEQPHLLEQLRQATETMCSLLENHPVFREKLFVASDRRSPIMHIRVADRGHADGGLPHAAQHDMLQAMAAYCLDQGLAVCTGEYVRNESFRPPPSLRVTTNAFLSHQQMKDAVRIICAAAAQRI